MLFESCERFGRVVRVSGRRETEQLAIHGAQAADKISEISVVTDVGVVLYAFPVVVTVPESETPGVTLTIPPDIVAGGVPGVGVKNAQGATRTYQGDRFLQVAMVFVGDEPQRRLVFCNRFRMNPEPELLVSSVIRRRQERVISVVEVRMGRLPLEARIPRQTTSRSKMDVVRAKPFLSELNGIAIHRSAVEYWFGKREDAGVRPVLRGIIHNLIPGLQHPADRSSNLLALLFVQEIMNNHEAAFFKLIDVIIGQSTGHKASHCFLPISLTRLSSHVSRGR